MNIFKVLNVGQGDSIIIRPPQGCRYNDETFFIDLGPGKNDITRDITDDEKVHIFLTHHDNDHLEGLRFFIGKMDQISEITVPLYQNEITLIARAILNLKGISSSRDCNEFIRALEEIVKNQAIVKSLVEGRASCPRLSFAYEGKYFCNHIECLNPPMHVESYNWIFEADKDSLVGFMHEVFTDSFAKEMELYIRANSNGQSEVDSHEFNHFWLFNREDVVDEVSHMKCNYVLDFIMRNIVLFRKFNAKNTRMNLRNIYDDYVKCTHDVCMVLKTNFDGKEVLLTGDASKKVFNRLIREKKDITASYLKMPHHGSKHNMNKKILDKINPEVAIISHDNGHFGKAKDTHPNTEILNLLSQKNIEILLTNDVVKDGITVMKKDKHNKNSYVDIVDLG